MLYVHASGQSGSLRTVSDLEDDLATDADSARGSDPERLVGQRFRQAMVGFHEEMQQRAAALDAEQDETTAMLRKLATFFGEDPNQANPDAILRSCAELVRQSVAAEALAIRLGLRPAREECEDAEAVAES